jgi:hypothetical protein
VQRALRSECMKCARGPSNNGMKLTARGASVEARQLIPVFGGPWEHRSGGVEGMAMRAPMSLALVGVATLGIGCERVSDRLAHIPTGATRADVLRIAGPPAPDEALPPQARTPPKGCADQLVYVDAYRAAPMRALAAKVDSSRMLMHVCFDSSGRKMAGMHFTFITY